MTGTKNYNYELRFNAELKKFLFERLKPYYTPLIKTKRVPSGTQFASVNPKLDPFSGEKDKVIEYCQIPAFCENRDILLNPNLKFLRKFPNSDELFLDLGIQNILIGKDFGFRHDGFIAGGAIANLINEYYFGVPAVINDIDYFFYDIDIKLPNESHEYIEGEESDTFFEKNGYRIINTEKRNKNNNIHLKLRYNFEWSRLLKSFDLNCTMAGFHPISGDIIFTDHFIDFLEKREIKIVDSIKEMESFPSNMLAPVSIKEAPFDDEPGFIEVNEPKSRGVHAAGIIISRWNNLKERNNLKFAQIIRANKKKKELKAKYMFDFDIKKIIYSNVIRKALLLGDGKIRIFTNFDKFERSSNEISCFIPKKEIKILFKRKDLLLPYFKIKRKNAKLYLVYQLPESKNNYIIQNWLDKYSAYTYDRFKLNYNMISQKKFPFDEVSRFEYRVLMDLFLLWDNNFLDRKAVSISKGYPMLDTLIFAFKNIVKNKLSLSNSDYNMFMRLIKEHSVFVGYLIKTRAEINLKDIIDIYRSIVKENHIELIGIIENKLAEDNPIFTQPKDVIFNYIKQEYIKIQKDDFLVKPLSLGKISLYVRELHLNSLLKSEGRDLQHCVGGYGSRVKAGLSRIFDINFKDSRSTLELDVIILSKKSVMYKIRQHKARSNRSPTKEHDILANLLVNCLNLKSI